MTGDGRGDMLEPLSTEERWLGEHAASNGNKDDYKPEVPVPEDAPDPDWTKLRPKEATGDPSIYRYHTTEGDLAFYVARWEAKDKDPNDTEKKVIRPVSLGGDHWQLRALPAPRPLYNLPALGAAPKDRCIVVVEGEKCADALANNMTNIVFVTWSGGAAAWSLTDWKPLAGRKVVLIADADKPGRNAMKAVAAHLRELGCHVYLYLPGVENGDDIFDWLEADGLDAVVERVSAGLAKFDPAVHAVTDQDGVPNDENWQTELLARVQGDKKAGIDPDPGAAFEPEILEKITTLKRDNPADWQRLRKRLKTAKAGIGDLEKAISRADFTGENLQGETVEYEEIEPWEERVDSTALLEEAVKIIEHYVDMPDGGAVAVAVWALYTWVFEVFEVTPYLIVTAPERESGKTLVTEIASYMVPRPKPVFDASAAAIYRGIAKDKPILLFDEAQQFLDRKTGNELVRGLLLSGYSKRFAFVERCEGDANEIRRFRTFTPKMMNGRNLVGMDDMLTSRSIVIPMTRTTKKMPILRGDKDPVGLDFRRKCLQLAFDNMELLNEADPEMGDLKSRAADIWRPLFAVADLAGGEWPDEVRCAEKALAKATAKVSPGDTLGVELLKDCYRVFQEAGNPDRMRSEVLDQKLIELPERPWATLGAGGKPMSARRRSDILRSHSIESGTHRFEDVSGESRKGYLREDFEEAWNAYVLPRQGEIKP